jgi:hypothetical protein
MAIVGGRIRDREAPHEPVHPVDADVVLVPEHRNGHLNPPLDLAPGSWLGPGPLQRPAGIPILLRQLLGLVLPAVRDAALLDRLLLRIRVALARCRDNRGVHDLACARGRSELNEQKEVFAEAKGEGLNVKVLKEIIKLRKQDKDERDEHDTLLDAYMRAMKSAEPAPIAEAA